MPSASHPLYTLRAATPADIPAIRAVASVAFPATYGAILTAEQVDYMMAWMYAPAGLQAQMAGGHRFFLAEDGEGRAIGYVSAGPPEGDACELHKLYVLPEWQGRGVGRDLFLTAQRWAAEAMPHGGRLTLHVNRHNAAQRFYRRMGMAIERSGDFDIGHGFFMNDYIMACPIHAGNDDAGTGGHEPQTTDCKR